MIRRRWLRWLVRGAGAIALLLTLAPLVSHEVRFVYRGGWELARLQWRARPIAALLADPTIDTLVRANLALTLAARRYAADSLGLDAGDSFTRYADVGRDTLILVLSASPHDTLAPHTWWFPITGRVAYHGYYSLDAAEAAARRLEQNGLDTYLRTAPAFSTLGWLPDPLLSTALVGRPYVAVMVTHELAHNTIWVPGQTTFSESLAELIGYRGGAAFFRSRGDSAAVDLLDRGWAQARRVSRIQMRLVSDLRDAFAGGRDAAMRERLRDAAFVRADSSLSAEDLWGGRALRVAIEERNNAAVIAAGLYHGDLDGLERLFQACGASIPRVIAAVRTAGRDRAGVEPCDAVAREVVPRD